MAERSVAKINALNTPDDTSKKLKNRSCQFMKTLNDFKVDYCDDPKTYSPAII